MSLPGRIVCVLGLIVAVAALATYPLSAAVAAMAANITLAPAPQATIVYDREDHPLFTFFREQRTDVPLDHVSQAMTAAMLAIEDRRFYQHHGIDFVRVLGAAWADLRARRFVQGGSSITQQLVRIDALSSQRTLSRKVREAMLAPAIERRFSKREILEAYLNRIYFGDGYWHRVGCARLFRQRRRRPHHPGSSDAGRHHPVAAPVWTARRARSRARAAECRAAVDGREREPARVGRAHARASTARHPSAGRRPGSGRWLAERAGQRLVLSRRDPPRIAEALRRRHRLQGRAARLHDVRTRPPAGGRDGGGRSRARPRSDESLSAAEGSSRAAAISLRVARPGDGRRRRARRRPRFRREPVRPRHPGASSAGLRLQATAVRGGDRAGLLAGIDHRGDERRHRGRR